ncbi:transmembrane protease serine 9-like [Musca autumnalis]|uniref:transmembrane protease serine 9-like n=1 Tax=Musca autumnalis TaxID=221902 RepID=UPI003CF34EA1
MSRSARYEVIYKQAVKMHYKAALQKQFLISIVFLLHNSGAKTVHSVYPQGRIVGGAVASEGQFPYQVSLRWSGAHVCGGSIIGPRYILTAAHCLTFNTADEKLPPSLISVRAGSRAFNRGGQVIEAVETYVHPDYKNFDNDIGVVKLTKPLEFNESVRAIPLATHEPPTGVPVITSGWGHTSNNGTVVEMLRYNVLSALTSVDCSHRLPAIPESVICLAHSQGNGVCDGDSGGPAVYNNQLVGVVNYMVRTCGSTAPDAYASVAYFLDWIEEKIIISTLVQFHHLVLIGYQPMFSQKSRSCSILLTLLLCSIRSSYGNVFYPQPRIVGGNRAAEGQFPHQVSVRSTSGNICGGSIISEYYVLTAAHCVASGSPPVKKSPSSIIVKAGSTQLTRGGQMLRVAEIIVHPDYDDSENDIALVKLEKPLKFSETVKPIALAIEDPPEGASIVISGWGNVREGGLKSKDLLYTTLTAMSNEKCNELLGYAPKSRICLAHRGGNGACDGDSGGPAVYKGKLVGVTNVVYETCGSLYPDGYASVAYYRDWIIENAKL